MIGSVLAGWIVKDTNREIESRHRRHRHLSPSVETSSSIVCEVLRNKMSVTSSSQTAAQQAITASARLVGGDTAASAIETGELPSTPQTDTHSTRSSAENPAWWPTDHRHIPSYLPVRYHPEWHALSGGSRAADLFIIVLFKGCGYIAVRNDSEISQSSWTNGS